MNYELYFEARGLPQMPNKLNRKHWAVKTKEAKLWKEIVYFNAAPKRPERPLKKAFIHYERHSSVMPDADGLAASFKHVQDGLKAAGIIIDDSPKVIETSHTWVKCAPSQGKITVRVFSREPTEDMLLESAQSL